MASTTDLAQQQPAVPPARRSRDDTWPVERLLDALGDEDLALHTLLLLVASRQWVHRRVEAVHFVDGSTFVRRVSVDLTVPETRRLRCGDDTLAILPIALTRRRTLVHFDLRDKAGDAVSLLGVRENQKLTKTMVLSFARQVLGGKHVTLDADVERDLCAFVEGTKDEVTGVFRTFENAQGGQHGTLWDDAVFNAFLRTLRYTFVVFVAVSEPAMRRLILKFSYERPSGHYRVHQRSPFLRLVGATFGLPLVMQWPLPMAEYGMSHHFELNVPDGAQIGQLRTRCRNCQSEPAGAEEAGPITHEHDRSDFMSGRVALHEIELPWGSNVWAQAVIVPDRKRWLVAGLLAMWLTAAVLLVAAQRLRDVLDLGRTGVEHRPDALVLLLVTLVAILATMLVRDDEHPLVKDLLVPPRQVTVAVGSLTVVASAVAVLWPGATSLPAVWSVLGVLALVLAVLQTVAVVLLTGDASGESPWSDDSREEERRRRAGKRHPLLRIRRRLVDELAKPAEDVRRGDKFFGGAVWDEPLRDGFERALREAIAPTAQTTGR